MFGITQSGFQSINRVLDLEEFILAEEGCLAGAEQRQGLIEFLQQGFVRFQTQVQDGLMQSSRASSTCSWLSGASATALALASASRKAGS